ncbi:MAG TPA: ABC transporter permease [Acidimicrobiales bacterium]
MAVRERDLAGELAGLDALDTLEALDARGPRSARATARRVWSAMWPKVAALGLVVLAWQALVWAEWRPAWVVPPPGEVLGELAEMAGTGEFWKAVSITMRRALVGYGIALVLGLTVGLAVARVRVLRTAVGSLITGLQTMPSIAWFPVAILLFGLSEQAITFVVVLGAAPSIANGIVSGVDHVPPILLRAGRVVGARGVALFRHVVVPAALPSCLAGLKQGWAFAWRSLMAGELLVIVAQKPSIGARLQFARELADAKALFSLMIVVLLVGIAVDTVFGKFDGVLRARRGLVDQAT